MKEQESKKAKIRMLQENLEKVKERIKQVEDRRRKERGNEDAWAGHGGPGYLEEESEYQVLLAHLEEIEAEIKKLEERACSSTG